MRKPNQVVGREAAIATILSHLDTHGACVVTGAAGIGKSIVLSQIEQRLAPSFDVITISGSEATSVVPLAPLLRLSADNRPNLVRAVLAELYRRSHAAKVLVVVDDAHLLDPESATVVRQLLGADEIPVLIAWRSGEAVPAPLDPVPAQSLVPFVELAALDRGASAQLVDQTLGPVTPQTNEWLWQLTLGHPLWLRELIMAGTETGNFVVEDGTWTMRRRGGWSPRLHTLVAHRLNSLSASERALFETLTVAGRVRLETLGELFGRATVAGLAERRMVSIVSDTVVPDHPLFAMTTRTAMPADRARKLRLRLADALRNSDDPVDVITRAVLRLEAGQAAAPSDVRSALDVAHRLGFTDIAQRLASELCRVAPSPESSFELATALAMQHLWDAAETAFHEAVDGLPPAEAAELWARWAMLMFECNEDPSAAKSVVEHARSLPTGMERPDLTLCALRIQMFTGNLDETVDAHDRAMADDRIPPEMADLVAVDVATCASHSGAFGRIAPAVDRFDFGSRAEPDLESVRIRCVELQGRMWTEGVGATRGAADTLVERARLEGDPDAESLALGYRGMILNDACRTAEAVDDLRAAQSVGQYSRSRRSSVLVAGELARALAFTDGGADEALGLIDMFRRAPAAVRWLSEPVVRLAQAELEAAAGGDPTEHHLAGIGHARDRGARIHEIALIRHRAHWLGPVGDVDDERELGELAIRAEELASVMGGVIATLMADAVVAIARDETASLRGVSRAAEAEGLALVAIDAAVTASASARRHGQLAEAVSAELCADRLLAVEPRAHSSTRVRLPSVLSAREREVVGRLIAGRSNREIADDLYISHRTVESHVRRVHVRLGLSGRRAIADLASA